MGKGIFALGAVVGIGGILLLTRKASAKSGVLVYSNPSVAMVLQNSLDGFAYGTPLFNVTIKNTGTAPVNENLALWEQSETPAGGLGEPMIWGNFVTPVSLQAGETNAFSWNPPLEVYGGIPLDFKGEIKLYFWMVDSKGGATPVAVVSW